MTSSALRVYKNGENYIVEVPAARRDDITALMAYRGLDYSVAASSRDLAILFSNNPYAVCDLDERDECKELRPYRSRIAASRALVGKGTTRLPPGKELWDYQKATLDYLLFRGGGLDGDEPGLGKTPTSLAFCNEVEAVRVLVIVPASIRLQWADKIKEWSTIPNVKVSTMLNVKDGIHPTAHYQVISYDSARNPAIIRAIGKYAWDVMICDEAHKMKNIDALTTRAIIGNGKGEYWRRNGEAEEKMPAITNYCNYELFLTGTPLLNRPSEAFTLLRHIDHEAIDFMGWDAFKERYNKQADMQTLEGKRFKLESTSMELELQNRLRVNVMARHLKRDVLKQMKPPRYSVVHMMETGPVKAALDAEGLLGLSVEEIQTTKDFKILGHIAEVRRLMGIALAPQIVEYVKDLLDGGEKKLVIFGWHIEVLDIFENALSEFGTVRVDGRKSAHARQKAVDDFIAKDDIQLFIGNIQAAGTGVDGLQKVCSHCLLAEPDWVPAQNEQAVSRLDRIGQEHLVNAEIFVAPGSISEKILVKALEKMNVIHRVLDEKKG